jgi:hypothetical protein
MRRRMSTGGMPMRVTVDEKTERELWTAEEFLDQLGPGVHADRIEGERCMHSPVAFRHADLLNFIDLLLRRYIETRGDPGPDDHRTRS